MTSPHYRQSNGLRERSIQTVKRTLNKAKPNSEDHFLTMVSLNSQPHQNGTSPAFGLKLRTTLPLLIPSTQSTATEKHSVTQNVRRKLPEIAPGITMRIRTNEPNLWDKKSIFVSQNNRPRLYNILNKRGNILARNRHHLISRTRKFNIKHDYDNAIPLSNTFTHPNLMIYNQHENPTLGDVYRTKSGCIVKKPKRYIDEM